MTDLSGENAIIITIANKLLKIRFALMPRGSRRESLYMQWVRPFLIRLIVRQNFSKLGKTASPSERKTPQVVTFKGTYKRREDVKEILIIKCDHIGDFILALQAYALLRKGFPAARITLLCSSWNKAMAQETGLFDHIVCIDIFNEISSAAAPNFDPAVLTPYNLPVFDIAINLKVEGDTHFLLNHIQAHIKAGFENELLDTPFNFAKNEPVPLDFSFRIPSRIMDNTINLARHTQVLLASLASGIINLFDGQETSRESLMPFVNEPYSGAIVRRGKGPLIGINTGSGAPTRDWPLGNYKALIQKLIQNQDSTIVLMGAKSQHDDGIALMENMPVGYIVNLIGTLPLVELPRVIHQLDLYIGHDTGTTHLAGILGQNTLCLHAGVTPRENFGPVGRNVTILKCVNLPCSPCGLKELSHCAFDHKCMRSISVERVAEEIQRIVTPPSAHAPVSQQENVHLASVAHS